MKKRWLFFFFIALVSPVAHAVETIHMVADVWCPYSCETTDSTKPGILVEMAQKAFAKHNIRVEYSVLPWTRAIRETRDGHYDAVVGAARSDAPDFVFPAVAQSITTNLFYVKKFAVKKEGSWRYTGPNSLDHASIGIVDDYTYGPEVDGYFKKYKNDLSRVQVMTGDHALESNVKKIINEHVTAVLESEQVMNYYLITHGLTDAVEAAGALPYSDTNNFYIAFSPHIKNAAHYAAILSQETKAMKQNGEMEAIFPHYGLSTASAKKP